MFRRSPIIRTTRLPCPPPAARVPRLPLSTILASLRRSRLVQGGLVVGAGILLGNITGFFRIAVTAYLVGTHARADALATATGPLDTLNSVIVNTMLFAFVPMLMLRQGPDRTALFLQAARVFTAILAGVSLMTIFLAPEIIGVLGPGLAIVQHGQAVTLLRILAPSTFFAGASAISAALLYTERRFLAQGLYQACLNGATIAVAVSMWEVLGVNGFAVGYTGGAVLQFLITRRASARFARRNQFDSPRAGGRDSGQTGHVHALCRADRRKHCGHASLCNPRRPRDGCGFRV